LKSAGEAFNRIREFISDIEFRSTHLLTPSLNKRGGTKGGEFRTEKLDMAEDLKPYKDKFMAAMDDDFNTASAIAAIFEMIKFCRKALDEGENEKECLQIMKRAVVELCEVLGMTIDHRPLTIDQKQGIEELIKEREKARQAKNFKRADEIRQQLQAQGIELEDTPLGTKWNIRT
jgi:cysteinyl-tRNA synthetase